MPPGGRPPASDSYRYLHASRGTFSPDISASGLHLAAFPHVRIPHNDHGACLPACCHQHPGPARGPSLHPQPLWAPAAHARRHTHAHVCSTLPAARSQVGGAVATEVLSAGRVRILDHGLRVGRLDSITPAPEGVLPPANADLDAWATFWRARGFNLTEAMALMGSHALIDEQVG